MLLLVAIAAVVWVVINVKNTTCHAAMALYASTRKKILFARIIPGTTIANANQVQNNSFWVNGDIF